MNKRLERDGLADLLGYNLRRAMMVVMADFAATLGDDAIRPTQFAILATLEANDGLSPGALGRALSVKKANMAPLISELERAGLIERRPSPKDRRVQALHLTDLGRERLPQWRTTIRDHEARLLEGFTLDERQTMTSLLHRLWNRQA